MDKPPIKDVNHHSVGVFLVTDDKKVIGCHRDDKPGIDNPGKIAGFSGTVEASEEPAQAAWRELVQEETNLKRRLEDLHHLVDDVAWRKLTEEWETRHFYYVFITEDELNTLLVYEGQGYAYIQSPNDPNLAESWRLVAKTLFKELHIS